MLPVMSFNCVYRSPADGVRSDKLNNPLQGPELWPVGLLNVVHF